MSETFRGKPAKERKYQYIIEDAKKQQAIELNKKWEWAEKRLLEIINKEDSNEQL